MLLIKFGQLFYYSVIKKETAISFKHFLKVFDGLWRKERRELGDYYKENE